MFYTIKADQPVQVVQFSKSRHKVCSSNVFISLGHMPDTLHMIFSQDYSFYFSLIFAHLWWFGGWGLGLGFWGWSLQLMGFETCGVGPVEWSLLGFFEVGALYIIMEE